MAGFYSRKFDSFERQVQIRKLKKTIEEQKSEEKQKVELKELKQEAFRTSPRGKVTSKVITGAKKLSALAVKALKAPKGKGKKTPKLKSFFGEEPKDILGGPPEKQTFNGLINSPFPIQKKKKV